MTSEIDEATQREDEQLMEVFLAPVRRCASYRPAFGKARGGGISLSAFEKLYGADPFYAWIGLNHSSVYAAHKAAGGLTSVYRQIGIGSERLFRTILQTKLGLSEEQINWSYQYTKTKKSTGTHTLDARIVLDDLSSTVRPRFEEWMLACVTSISGSEDHAEIQAAYQQLRGVAFEVRQGYKSADSKRQNADLRYGVNAYRVGLLPAFSIFSTQVSEPVLTRYRANKMLVLTGLLSEDTTKSTFAFFEDVVGYSLKDFFERNTDALKEAVEEVVEELLEA